jgi:hypothetical protein
MYCQARRQGRGDGGRLTISNLISADQNFVPRTPAQADASAAIKAIWNVWIAAPSGVSGKPEVDYSRMSHLAQCAALTDSVLGCLTMQTILF